VCGGAFNGLEKIISARGRSASIGFSAKVLAPEDRKAGEVFRDALLDTQGLELLVAASASLVGAIRDN